MKFLITLRDIFVLGIAPFLLVLLGHLDLPVEVKLSLGILGDSTKFNNRTYFYLNSLLIVKVCPAIKRVVVHLIKLFLGVLTFG